MMSAIIYNTVSSVKKLIHNQSSDYEVLELRRGGGSCKFLKNLFAALALSLVSGLSVAASSVSDSLQFRILFSVSSSAVQTGLSDNGSVLSEFWDAYSNLSRNDSSSVTGLSISICGSSSVEGIPEKNQILAQRRADAVCQYLRQEYSIPDSLITKVYTIPAEDVAESVLSSFPDSCPGIDLPSIRKIVQTVESHRLKQAFRKLDGCDDGANWTWYKENILNPSRYAQISLYFSRIIPAIPPVLKEEETIEEPESPVVPEQNTAAEAEQTECLESEFRLGTNLLYDVATVANLYFEAGFASHLALDLSATFSPWNMFRPDVKLRTLLVQPELRWYFADNFKGHYLGIEGHCGWWNVALGGKTRYQDKDGNTPLWGAGLSYGYVLEFNEHLGMDFGISAGYANLKYDCFYNIEDGAKFTTKTRDWWGPTKVGVSIYYQF